MILIQRKYSGDFRLWIRQELLHWLLVLWFVLGVYPIGMFLPDVIMAVKGLIGIGGSLSGLMFIIFGILIFKE